MKEYIVTVYEDDGSTYGVWSARFEIQAGFADRQDITVNHAPGVDKTGPIVQISYRSGTERHSSGTYLPGITPEQARRLASALLLAADDAEKSKA